MITIDMEKFNKNVNVIAEGDDFNTSFDIDGNTAQDTTTGKNLANITSVDNNLSKQQDVITLANGSTGSNFINFESKTLETNVEYVMELFIVGTTTNNVSSEYVFKDSSNNNIFDFYSSLNQNVSRTFTPTSAITINKLNIYNSTSNPTTGAVSFKIQIRKSSTSSGYEPYTGGIASPNTDYPQEVNNITGDIVVSDGTNSVTIPLSTEELCKIGTYKDKINIDLESGVVSKVGNIGKLVLDGNTTIENYIGTTTNTYIFQVKSLTNMANITTSGSAYCNILNQINYSYSYDGESYYLTNTDLVFKINKTTIDAQTGSTTKEKVLSYLGITNLILYGPLLTPTTSTITTLSSSDLSTLKNILNGETITVTANLDTDYTIVQSYKVTKLITVVSR